MDFAFRPPSSQWEPVSLVPGTMLGIWVWCKPAHAPQDLIIRVPTETIAGFGGQLTVRQVLLAAGAELPQVYGVATPSGFIEALGGANPLLDQYLPAINPGVDLTVRMHAAPSAMVVPPPIAAGGGLSGGRSSLDRCRLDGCGSSRDESLSTPQAAGDDSRQAPIAESRPQRG